MAKKYEYNSNVTFSNEKVKDVFSQQINRSTNSLKRSNSSKRNIKSRNGAETQQMRTVNNNDINGYKRGMMLTTE